MKSHQPACGIGGIDDLNKRAGAHGRHETSRLASMSLTAAAWMKFVPGRCNRENSVAYPSFNARR
jgi:hypothetical protein